MGFVFYYATFTGSRVARASVFEKSLFGALSPVTAKPATRGHFKTGHSEARYSDQVS
jgi:hypothetical protein